MALLPLRRKGAGRMVLNEVGFGPAIPSGANREPVGARPKTVASVRNRGQALAALSLCGKG